jgi:hypothetical protein
MMDTDRIGACGDNCSACLRLIATESDDVELLERVRDIWVTCGWRSPDATPRDMECWGCRQENRCAYPALRDCVFGRRLETCGHCADYPCGITREVLAREDGTRRAIAKCCRVIDRGLLITAFTCKRENLDAIHRATGNGD